MHSSPETGRITLTLTANTIRKLRLLAHLTGVSQNDVAEDLLVKGGLHAAVDRELAAVKPALEPENAVPFDPAPTQQVAPSASPAPSQHAPDPIPMRASNPSQDEPPPARNTNEDIPW